MNNRDKSAILQAWKASKNFGGKSLNDHVLLVDGLNMFIRCFVMVPSMNDNGQHVGGMVGFLKSLGLIIRSIRPTRVVIVFDGAGGNTRRRKLFPEYKSGRSMPKNLNRFEEFETPNAEAESMKIQIMRLVEYLDALPVSVMSLDGCEADDVIGYIATKLLDKEVTIVSTDKDFMQLINDRIHVWAPVKKKLLGRQDVVSDFNCIPENLALVRSFLGDTSDNIPGVNGVGIKTLAKLFPELISKEVTPDDIIELIKDRSKVSKFKIYKNLVEGIDDFQRNYQLMQLSDVDISADLKSRIRTILDAPPPKLDYFAFRKMFAMDRLQDNIKYADEWLTSTFNSLNLHAKK